MDILGEGQRIGNRSAVFRKNFCDVPAAAQAGRIRRHGHRIGHLQENRGTAWRRNLGRITTRAGLYFSLRAGRERSEMKKLIGDEGMPIEVLLVEDSPGDVRLTQEAFREANSAIHLHVATDGVEAMAFLNRQGVHADAPRPDLILLDLNLPKMDGREVLAHIKDDAALKTIPTLILTTSASDEDIAKCYQLQANCYLTKPVQLDAFDNLVKSVNDFWLAKTRLPNRPDENQASA